MIGQAFETKNVTLPEAAAVRSGRLSAGDEILGRYVVQAELGEGGMGVVYKCFDKVAGVEVAIKGLPPEVVHNRDELEAVKDNFQLVRGLRHPNIAAVLTLERDERTQEYFLVMDYAPGESLNRWMAAHFGRAHRLEQIAVLRQIAKALDYAHSAKPKSIIHRDIKPENILVDGSGEVKILDFGLAAQVRTSMSRVSLQVKSRSGTPAYKSPEQWRGQPQRASADQYALGVIAYKMFSGDVPFDGDDVEILGRAVLNEPVPSVDDASVAENAVLARVLSKAPGGRYPTCSAFVDALTAAGGGNAQKFESVPSLFRTIPESKVRSRFWIWGTAVAIMVAVGCCVMYRCFLGSADNGKREKPAVRPPKSFAVPINPVPVDHVPTKSPVSIPAPASVPVSHVHRYGAWLTVVKPRCEAAGSRQRVCVASGCTCPPVVETSTLPALGHAWGEWMGVSPPEVGVAGRENRTCTQCGQAVFREVPPLVRVAHAHSFGEWMVVVQPKCTVPGKRSRFCTAPGCTTPQAHEDETVPELGHDWGPWEAAVASQIGVAGENRRQCRRCLEQEKIATPPLRPNVTGLLSDARRFADEARKVKGARKKECWQKCYDAAAGVLACEPGNVEARRLMAQAENGLSTFDSPKMATPQNTDCGKRDANGVEWFNNR